MLQEIVLFGIEISTYKLFHILGFVVTIIFGIIYAKRYNLKWTKALITIAILYAFIYLIMLFLTWAESGFESWGSRNIIRSLVYAPLISILVSKIMGISAKSISDFAAPCIGLCITVSRIGCILYGCCFGYHCSWGIMNTIVNDRLFPVQIFEVLTAGAVTYIAYLYAKKNNFNSNGKVYPLFLLLFGSTRFFWEFFRDNRKVLWGMSSLALHAAFMAVVGAIILYYLCKKDKEIVKKHSKANFKKKLK